MRKLQVVAPFGHLEFEDLFIELDRAIQAADRELQRGLGPVRELRRWHARPTRDANRRDCPDCHEK